MQDTTEITYDTGEVIALEYSPQVGELMMALAKAQAEMQNPDTDSYNPWFKSRYPSMAAVRNATVPILAKHGIATTQHPHPGKGWIRCITVLWHGEQYLKTTMHSQVIKTRRDGGSQVVPVAELNHQDYTAVFNYLRRISLQAVCNIAGEEDDDGNQGAGKSGQTSQPETRHDRARPTSRPTAAEEAVMQAETARLDLLDEVAHLYQTAVQPLKHAGMHKAIFHHCFGLDKPELIKEQPLETFQTGIALYRHLTAQVVTWDRSVSPHAWIAEQQRLLATQAEGEASVPEGVDSATGEVHRDMPDGWLTEEERREQQRRDEAALLAHAEHD